MDQSQLAAIAQWLQALQGLERESSELEDPARTAEAYSKMLGDLTRSSAFDEESSSCLAELHALAPEDS